MTLPSHAEELVLWRQLDARVENHPDRELLFDLVSGHCSSYGDHRDRVVRLATGMANQLGLGREDTFAVLAPNSHRYIELWHAAFLGAGVIVPLNSRLISREIAALVADCRARVVFVDPGLRHLLEHVPASGSRRIVHLGDSAEDGEIAYEELLASTGVRPPVASESDVVSVLYTGGTTGRPKGVVTTQRAHMLNQYHAQMVAPVAQGWRFLQHTPLYHSGCGQGIVRVPLFGCTEFVLPTFHAAEFLRVVEQHKINVTVLLPTLIAMILEHQDFRPEALSSLRRIAYGGSPMPPPLMDRLMSMLPEVELTQVYGMTESGSALTMLTGPDHRTGGPRLASVGRPLPGVQVTIRGIDGGVVPVGEVGEVCAQGGNLMAGYWEIAEETNEALRGGWFHTGDIGRFDEDGYLYLLDRARDMIVTGGENVFSAEVEAVIAGHPAVAQVVVIGIPHDVWGEAIHAIVVIRAGMTLAAAEVQAYVRGRIAGYKVPKSVEFRTGPLPLSGANKLLKREIRAAYWPAAVKQ